MNNKKELGKLIRQAREVRYKGLNELAKELKISATYLSQLERGLCSFPSVNTLKSIADKLSLDSDKLTFLAQKIPSDLIEIIHEDPEHYATFLRREAKKHRGKPGILD